MSSSSFSLKYTCAVQAVQGQYMMGEGVWTAWSVRVVVKSIGLLAWHSKHTLTKSKLPPTCVSSSSCFSFITAVSRWLMRVATSVVGGVCKTEKCVGA